MKILKVDGGVNDKSSKDYWARFCWTNTIEKLHIDFDIALFGDSITRGSDFQLCFPDVKIINLGYSGDNILGMLKRIPMIQKSNAKKVFIMAGTNDLQHITLNESRDRYERLIRNIQDSIPDIRIYVQSVIPTNSKLAGGGYAPNIKVQEANLIAEKLAHQYKCTYIDIYNYYVDDNNELPSAYTTDGVHLLPEKYIYWANEIRQYIYE